MLRFGTDGVRGRALTEITADGVAALGHAAAEVLDSRRWLIGYDTRESGPALAAAFAAGVGPGAEMLGVVPTPAVAFWSKQVGVPAAVITASHNPWHDNGVKIFAAGGVKLSDDVERSIEAAQTAAQTAAQSSTFEIEQRFDERRVLDDYVDRLVADAASLHGLSVVVDCANGAMSGVAPAVFERVGATVRVIHASPNGRNINDACGATSPASLAQAVVASHADLGLAFDGDGDRVIAVDHQGKIIDGDRLIALAALQLRDQGELTDDTVVVTVMSNLGFRRAMERAGIRVVETAVGDRYVLEALDAGGFAVGGEQSGHIIYRHLATTGDGLLAGLRLAQHVVRRGRPLAELAAEVMSSYPQVLTNVRVASRHPDVANELAAEIAAAQAELAGDGRVLVRASGTEPLIRVMVEAATVEIAERTAGHLAEVVARRFA